MTEEEWEETSTAALALFARGQDIAKRGTHSCRYQI